VSRDTLLMLALVGGLLLLGRGSVSDLPAPKKKEGDDVNEDQSLVARARTGLDWAAIFESIGAAPALAAGLARWVGIESGGNPRAVSRLGERGLLQALPTTRKAFFTDAEWEELGAPATTNERHAQLALKEFAWLLKQAETRIPGIPDDDYAGQLFAAKLYHQRPKDLWDVKLTGPGAAANAQLSLLWGAKAPNSEHRRKAAAVVAWGNTTGGVPNA
jgi:hypothetical protein